LLDLCDRCLDVTLGNTADATFDLWRGSGLRRTAHQSDELRRHNYLHKAAHEI
jgi:hypothetical protein